VKGRQATPELCSKVKTDMGDRDWRRILFAGRKLETGDRRRDSQHNLKIIREAAKEKEHKKRAKD